MQEYWEKIEPNLIEFAERLVAALLVLLIGKLLIRLVKRALRKGKLVKRADPTVMRFVTHAVNISLNIVLVVSVVAILGIPMSSVIAVIASAGVAIGLALQGSLSNFAGSIMLLIFRPFHLEDYIEANDVGGTVKDIGLFYTTLETPDRKVVTLPNGTLMNSQITNYSVSKIRRVDLTFSVAYGTDVETVKQLLLKEGTAHPLVLTDPAPLARLSAQGDSSLDFILRVYVKGSEYWQVRFDLNETIYRALEQSGIEIPYPQMDVHIKDGK